jgi:type IV pilus assembly protein PilX
MKTIPSIGRPHRSQSGAALPVVLLLLLIVTLLGIASMRGAIMEERMASNTMARGMAFQVAEAGLRQAELIVRDGTITFPSSGCSAGRCAMFVPGLDTDHPDQPAWLDDGFWTSGTGFQTGSTVKVGDDLDPISPLFVIEDFGETTNAASGGGGGIDMAKKPPDASATQHVYRITSHAVTPNGVEVVLQSLYRR